VSGGESPRRLAVVVHPSRPLAAALATLEAWASRHGIDVVQVSAQGAEREVFRRADVAPGDLVVALGGDGTALAALRAAVGNGTPVLAVACGSVGALSATTGERLGPALDRMRTGEWTACPVPALVVGAPDRIALNDFVVVRRGAGQVVAEVSVNGELYVRVAGDGLIVATPLGSSGYTMAAGGPLLPLRTPAFVCTPLAMHGGSAPPLVLEADAVLTVDVHPSYAGFDVEFDGQRQMLDERSFRLTLEPDAATLVRMSDGDQGLRRLRERGLIADSPRALIRLQRHD
jgi:NAD+ kinase